MDAQQEASQLVSMVLMTPLVCRRPCGMRVLG